MNINRPGNRRQRMTLTEIRAAVFATVREILAVTGVITLLRPVVSDYLPTFPAKSAEGQRVLYWALLIGAGMLTWLIFCLIALIGLSDRDPVPLPPGTKRPWHYVRDSLRRRRQPQQKITGSTIGGNVTQISGAEGDINL